MNSRPHAAVLQNGKDSHLPWIIFQAGLNGKALLDSWVEYTRRTFIRTKLGKPDFKSLNEWLLAYGLPKVYVPKYYYEYSIVYSYIYYTFSLIQLFRHKYFYPTCAHQLTYVTCLRKWLASITPLCSLFETQPKKKSIYNYEQNPWTKFDNVPYAFNRKHAQEYLVSCVVIVAESATLYPISFFINTVLSISQPLPLWRNFYETLLPSTKPM